MYEKRSPSYYEYNTEWMYSRHALFSKKDANVCLPCRETLSYLLRTNVLLQSLRYLLYTCSIILEWAIEVLNRLMALSSKLHAQRQY